MKLENIHLTNYRCFEKLSLKLHPKLTVFVAENGAGKTAVLDAIASGLSRYLAKLPGVSGLLTKETDLRVDKQEHKTPFLMLAWQAKLQDGSQISWSVGRKRDSAVDDATIQKILGDEGVSLRKNGRRQIEEYAVDLVKKEAEGNSYFLPVVAYYGTNRALRGEIHRRSSATRKFTRFEALAGAFDSDSRFRAAFEWFIAMEDVERRAREAKQDFKYCLPELTVVRAAIMRMLPAGFSNPRTEIRPLRFVIDKQSTGGMKQTLRISQLSDGYRAVLGLAMDLARRMAQANSHQSYGGSQILNPLDLPAIVLIDEVDLHLHPSWQQRVLPDLSSTFKGTQFIVTTHSPQVLSTVKSENIRVIGFDADGKSIAEPPLSMTYGMPSSDVMLSVQFVDPQPPVKEKGDLQKLTERVDQGLNNTTETDKLWVKLESLLGKNHPQLLRLRRSSARQKALEK